MRFASLMAAGLPLMQGDAVESPSNQRLERIDEPARPIGPKREALHLRRQRHTAARAAMRLLAANPESRCLRSRSGDVSFVLRASPVGLLIERKQCPAGDPQLLQCMVFVEPDTFDRWCDSEPMRFEEPVLCDQLRREGHAALRVKA